MNGMRHAGRALVLVLIALFATACEAEGASCSFIPWSTYLGSKLLRLPRRSPYAFATEKVKVDADGAPNAYHPDDVGLDCAKGSGFKGLDCPANAGYPRTAWWPSVLVPDPADPKQAFVQPPPGEFAGYFVSQTSLKDQTKAATDPAKYVDARTVPYLVLPGNFYKMKGTGGLGDIGFAVNVANGKAAGFVIAEVGPPAAPLGEMSIALAAALGGSHPNPRTGSGAPSGKILYVVFPGSRAAPAWPKSSDGLASESSDLLNAIGGVEALTSCRDAF
jgi:hypothetical protein